MINTVLAPQIDANDDDVEVVAWHVASGTYVEAGQEIAELETSKTTMTVSAECAGYVDYLLPVRARVRVGDALCRITTSREELDARASPLEAAAHVLLRTGASESPAISASDPPVARETEMSAVAAVKAGNGREHRGRHGSTRFSKSAMRLLETHALAADAFQGAGLVTAAVVSRAIGLADSPRPAPDREQSAAAVAPAAPVSAGLHYERVSASKQAEIAALSLGASGHINSTLSVRFDSAGIRSRLRHERLFDGSLQPLALYEVSRLLKQWRQLMAFYEADVVHYYDRIDLGLAMDLGKGLKVVTIRNADQLTPIQIFEHAVDCGRRYLENRLRPEELTGSTLTITDLSGFDILQFQPLINGKQSAIIGLGGDQTLPGQPMTISLTFDHRVASGRDVALFLGELRARLLSYSAPGAAAESGASATQQRPSPAPVATVLNRAAAASVCERCGVDIESYYGGFARDGYMLAFYRPDGSLGGVCHRCFGSWN